MGKRTHQNIFLCSGYTPRSTALVERVQKACGHCGSVMMIEDSSHILEKRVQNSSAIVILDLPNIKQSAIQTIDSVKKQSANVKILAIHIYTTKLLIEPLIKAGIHGYLTYEPSIAELREALAVVMGGELYLPAQIYG